MHMIKAVIPAPKNRERVKEYNKAVKHKTIVPMYFQSILGFADSLAMQIAHATIMNGLLLVNIRNMFPETQDNVPNPFEMTISLRGRMLDSEKEHIALSTKIKTA